MRMKGRTDRHMYRHDESNSSFPQFCERAQQKPLHFLYTWVRAS